jgi:hypothetical protein
VTEPEIELMVDGVAAGAAWRLCASCNAGQRRERGSDQGRDRSCRDDAAA